MEREGCSENNVAETELSEQAAAIQILLAEKRTSLAVMRTAIAMVAVPLSITTVLVTLSRYFSWLDNLHFLIPMYAVLTVLVLFSLYLLLRSVRKTIGYDRLIEDIRKESPVLRRVLR